MRDDDDLLAVLAAIRARGGVTAEERADLDEAIADGERAQRKLVCPLCEGASAAGRPGTPACNFCRDGFIQCDRMGRA